MTAHLKEIAQRIADYSVAHARTNIVRRGGVRACAEFERIEALPRRQWSDADTALLVRVLSETLRVPGGSQTLRPIQAIALYEIAEFGGMLGPIGVGEGKTLVTLLAPRVLVSHKPCLILPAKLIEKTRRELLAAAKHWRVAGNIDIVSYEWLGRAQAAQYLARTMPDCIVLDEAHKARNKRAAVTRRVLRYCENRRPHCIALSGTLIKKRIADWAYLADSALGERSPAPRKWNTIEHWGNALDLGGNQSPGCLSQWQEGYETIRQAYRRRVVETAGVVATTEALCDIALNAERWECDIGNDLREALETLRNSWILPDGFSLTDPLAYYRAARQLALGCFYRWKIQPPDEWRNARRDWGSFVRHTCHYRRRGGNAFDSELQVRQAVETGTLPEGKETLDAWRAVAPTFKPEIEHVWVTSEICEALVAAANAESPAIVWIESVAVGLMMHALGLPYYGREASTPKGKSILDASGPIAASIQSCSEGQNLQDRWSRNIISAPLQDATTWEQLLGRTHRPGQEADEVSVQVAWLGPMHEECWYRAREHARYLEQISGQRQKLLAMTLVDLPDRERRSQFMGDVNDSV